MKSYAVYFLIFISLVLSSCGNPKGNVLYSRISRDSLSILTEHVQVSSTDLLELKSYYVTSFIDFDSIKGIMAYNYRLHSLDLINLQGECRISSIPLQREGPNGIPGRVCSICPVSKDSIWVYDGIAMYLMDSMGGIRDKISFENNGDIHINTNYAMCTAHFFFNKEHASLLYLVDCGSFIIEEYDIRKRCVLKSYSLSNSVVNPKRKLIYGDMDIPNISFAEDKIVYNYPYESRIYLLDLISGEQSVLDAESIYTPNVAHDCLSNGSSAWERHRIENIHFFDVMYLPKIQTFVRLHTSGVAFDSTKSVLSLLDSKNLYMSVFDKDFQFMGEVKLSDKQYNLFTGWCALEDALLLFDDNSLADLIDYERLSMDILAPVFAHAKIGKVQNEK